MIHKKARATKDYGTKVYVDGPSDFNNAVRRFTRRVESFGIVQEVKDRQHFLNKRDRKRRKALQCTNQKL